MCSSDLGEEANVIFGCVRNDEMNDYVSYTVIATGFDSARTKPAYKKTEDKEKETFRGGFNFLNSPDVDKDDLDVPTIMRVNKPKASLEDEEETPAESGFKYEASRYNWVKDKAEKKKQKEEVNSDDEEDSSSFLKMIMD